MPAFHGESRAYSCSLGSEVISVVTQMSGCHFGEQDIEEDSKPVREMAVQCWLKEEDNEELRAATSDGVVIEQGGGATAWSATALRNSLTETLTEIFTLVFSFLFLLHVQNQNFMTVSLALLWLGHIHGRGVGKRGAEGRDVGDVERRSGHRCVACSSPNQLAWCTVLLRLGRAASAA